MTLTVDNSLVDTACSDAVVACCLNARETLIVTEVEVCLHTVGCHVTLAMFIRIQRSRVNVNIRIKLLNGDAVASRLQQFTDAGGDDALS